MKKEIMSAFKKSLIKGSNTLKKKAPISLAVGGAGYLGYKLNKGSKTPKSGRDYNTLIRNNVLAGNISKDELSLRDLQSVRKLGLK